MALGATTMTCKSFSFKKRQSDIGIQLFTVRDEMAKDPIYTLKQLKQMGYDHIECAGYADGKFYDFLPEEFSGILNDIGLKMCSSHVFVELDGDIIDSWQKSCETSAKAGLKYVVNPWLFEHHRSSIDSYKYLASLYNQLGEIADNYNLKFCHHNHDFELLPIDNIVPFDILLNETQPNLVNFELDFYWMQKAGADIFKYFDDYKGRFPLFHIKDMDATEEGDFTEVGNGIIDWNKIFKYREKAGMTHFYVEQDNCKRSSVYDCVEISYNNLILMNI